VNWEPIIQKLEALPEESRKQLLACLDFLAERASEMPPPGSAPGFKFDWAGGLADAYPGVTAVELQHKISECR
jgi:hypothetical protein